MKHDLPQTEPNNQLDENCMVMHIMYGNFCFKKITIRLEQIETIKYYVPKLNHKINNFYIINLNFIMNW